jgi:bifunctional UDP-N-acetylglucosamine pyrophosphorylase/glucosamine-1-phosphate N-acetyltransferase
MDTMQLATVILAAGKGTRMKSDLVKVLHPLEGIPMVAWPVDAARKAGSERTVVVVGHQGGRVRDYFVGQGDLAFAVQEEQLGTGHAVVCAAPELEGRCGTVLILCGDVPLLRPATLTGMVQAHRQSGAAVTVLTTRMADPFGYGRIIRDAAGRIVRIVEEKDASTVERHVDEINSGIYCVESPFLFEALKGLKNDNAQGEYYLTDIVAIAGERGLECRPYHIGDSDEVMGVNDRLQLAQAASQIRRRTNAALMLEGVSIVDPECTYIEATVTIGRDTTIHPGACIRGATRIGSGCTVEPHAVITDCVIGDGTVVKAGTVMEKSVIHDCVAVGPMAHLRPGTELMAHVKIGNFVETKKVVIGEGSKASHLTYLGDATVGRDVNIGCGTITCNYDGVNKHLTVIEDDVFVGSDVQLVAPVTVGRNSLVAAGTTVTMDVPPDSLAIARTPQVNKVGWKLRKAKGH